MSTYRPAHKDGTNAAALKAKGYDYRYIYALGAGHTYPKVFNQTLADTLVWMWRGYHSE